MSIACYFICKHKHVQRLRLNWLESPYNRENAMLGGIMNYALLFAFIDVHRWGMQCAHDAGASFGEPNKIHLIYCISPNKLHGIYHNSILSNFLLQFSECREHSHQELFNIFTPNVRNRIYYGHVFFCS